MARVPLYKKAETELLRRIRSGSWPVGTRIGNEFELAEEFGVSQGTMRRALMSVEAMGLLHRKPGRGTVVADPGAAQTAPTGSAIGFLTQPDGAPLDLEVFRARLLSRMPEAGEADIFTGRLHALSRTLKSAGERFALEEITLPRSELPEMDEDQPIEFPDLLAALGLTADRIEDRLHAEMTSMGDSVALSCDRHTALLCLTRTALSADGRVLARQVLRIAGPVRFSTAPGT